MNLTLDSIYALTEREKRDILKNVLPYIPEEDLMTVNKELWQTITDDMKNQRKEIDSLHVKIDNVINSMETLTHIVNESVETKKAEEKKNSDKAVSDRTYFVKPEDTTSIWSDYENTDDSFELDFDYVLPVYVNVLTQPARKADRSSFRPRADAEREERDISDSWDEIFASIKNGTYRTKYRIGNCKKIDLGKEGIINMQIAAFDADRLADGSGKAAITWISRNLLNTRRSMNPELEDENLETYILGTGGIGGWKESEMRKYLNNEIRRLLPENIRTAVKTVLKYSYSIDKNGNYVSNEITKDALWIPSVAEVFGEKNQCSVFETESFYYKSLFSCEEDRMKAAWWWLRSAYNYISFTGCFSSVYSDGSYNYGGASYMGGVALSFCT